LYFTVQNLNTICVFVKIDHGEALKILGRKRSGCFQDLKATIIRKYFISINPIFQSVCFYCTDPAKK